MQEVDIRHRLVLAVVALVVPPAFGVVLGASAVAAFAYDHPQHLATSEQRAVESAAEWRSGGISSSVRIGGTASSVGRALARLGDSGSAPNTTRFPVSGSADELADIERHLRNIGALNHPPNQAMLAQIRQGQAAGCPLTQAEQNFLRHELIESSAMDAGMLYDDAHRLAGAQHPTFANYSPEVIARYPEHFNSNWRAYWGIE